jgi:ABC-type branched-subunit amino acid transport system substrate-binding protein
MTRLTKSGVAAALLAATCLLFAACGSTTTTSGDDSTSTPAPTEPIKLGYIVPDWTTLLKTTGRKDLNAKQMIAASKREMKALVDWANANGGIDGRKIVAKPYVIEQTATPDQLNAACNQITEDDHQEIVIDVSIFTNEQAWSCFAAHKTAYIGIVTATDNAFMQGVSPYVASVYPRIDTQMKAMAQELPKVGFFKGKLGVVLEDDPVLHKAYEQTLAPALKAAGMDPVVKFIKINDTTSINNAVLALKSAGVDHVIQFINIIEFLAFTNQAQQQGYHPTYAFPDFQALNQVAAQYGNPEQNANAVALSPIDGWNAIAEDNSRPSTDLFSPIKPGQVPPAQIECRKTLTKQLGTDYMNPGQAGSSTFESNYCDNFLLWLDAARKIGKGWTPNQFGDGLSALGTSYQSSRVHATDFADGTLGGGSEWAVGVYDAKCKCFVRKTDWNRLT